MRNDFDFDTALAALQDGQKLTGKSGILTPLIKQLTEAALEAEIKVHLQADTEVLASNYSVIAMDQRNAGASIGAIEADHGWHTYAADHLARANAAFSFLVRLVGAAELPVVNFTDFLARLARDLFGLVLWLGSAPADMPDEGSCSPTVTSLDFLGACCCRNARHIEPDVA
jgi:hypothetical protein